MNERFSEQSREFAVYAKKEAARLHHDYVGTEHLLLGLIKHYPNMACGILAKANIDLDELTREIIECINPAAGILSNDPETIPFTIKAKNTFEVAALEARTLGSKEIEPEHFLLALLKDNESVAKIVLAMFKLDYDKALELFTGEITKKRRRLEFTFSKAVRDALRNATCEAKKLQNSYIGITHLFFGLICLTEDPAVRLLIEAGVDLGQLRSTLERQLIPDPQDQLMIDIKKQEAYFMMERPIEQAELRYSSDFVDVINRVMKEAQARNLKEINTACLLLAILGLEGCLVADVLAGYGVTYNSIQSRLEQTT